MSFASGRHCELLDIARPRFQEYAKRHSCDYVEPSDECGRPSSWAKITNMLKLLDTYDSILWLDADLAMVDTTLDIEALLPPESIQGMVIHNSNWCGEVPNCGMWVVRRPMKKWLQIAWELEVFKDHQWWEQAAIMTLMGYLVTPNNIHNILSKHLVSTELYQQTYFLPLNLNMLNGYGSSVYSYIHHCSHHNFTDRVDDMKFRLKDVPEVFVEGEKIRRSFL